jgi:hypothetical protein
MSPGTTGSIWSFVVVEIGAADDVVRLVGALDPRAGARVVAGPDDATADRTEALVGGAPELFDPEHAVTASATP